MPRPRSLTPDGIAAAALRVIDRDGLGALTMRAVAGELGIGAMSLYRYVDDREGLERLVVDHVLRGIDLGTPPDASWDERARLLVGRVRGAIGAHAAVAPLLLAHRHEAEGTLRFGEAMLGLLTEAGLSGRDRVAAFRALLSYVLGALQYQHLGALAGAGTEAMARLPGDAYPLLSATARDGRGLAPDDEFRRGLDFVLAGIRAGFARR